MTGTKRQVQLLIEAIDELQLQEELEADDIIFFTKLIDSIKVK